MADILLIYGTTTGNTEVVASKINQYLTEANHNVTLKNVAQTSVEELNNYQNIIIGSSTWDDGQLQSDVAEFIQKFKASSLSLAGKKIAIFSLGDIGYPEFCASGELLEKALITDGVSLVDQILKIDGFPDMEENLKNIEIWSKKIATLF